MIFKNNKIKPIIQEEIADCGLACLTMILNSFGKEYSIHYLKNIYASTTEGFNLYDIANIAKKEKLIPLPFNIDQEEFQDLKLPCIAHLEENHFVVIENINKKNVTYLDPQEGEITLKHTDFFKRFSFVVCEFEKEDSFKKDEGDSKEIKKINSIFNYVKYKGFLGKHFSYIFNFSFFRIFHTNNSFLLQKYY
jgi:ATP-binding cassette subfamily B protein RaxB